MLCTIRPVEDKWNFTNTDRVFYAWVFPFCILTNSYNVDIVIQRLIADEWLARPNICIQVKLSATYHNRPTFNNQMLWRIYSNIMFNKNDN